MLDRLMERRPLSEEEFYVRRPVRARRSIALLVDVSGSMDGARARLAAGAVGALASELRNDELTVIAFWKDLAILRLRSARIEPVGLVEELMRIEPAGLTNITGAVELAKRELMHSSLEQRQIVLLSDCLHNAGPDPVRAAESSPPVFVLLDRTEDHDELLGRRIAGVSGGRMRSVRHIRDVGPALAALLND